MAKNDPEYTVKGQKLKGPRPPHYQPRNTTLDLQGNVRVRGEIVCRPKGPQITGGSFYTAKGGSRPVVELPEVTEAPLTATL